MGFLRRMVCGCGTKSLPIQSPTYESCIPSTFSPMAQDHDTWAPGRWACSSSPVADQTKKMAGRQIDGTCASEASTELPGAIMESPNSSINAVLPFSIDIQRGGSKEITRAQTAPPQARPRVTYFSDSRISTSGMRRKAPPPLAMLSDNKRQSHVQDVQQPFMVGDSNSPVQQIQKPWSH
jgi:hypothetical protein